VSLPFWMSGPMTDMINQGIQRQQALNPSATPLPADFGSTMGSLMSGTLWVAAIIGAVICAVAVIGALNRWTWLWYVVLVLLGLSAISIPLNLVSAVSGSAVSSVSGFSMPSWIYWSGILLSIPAVALFVWMLVAQVRHGPWAMRRVS
jgi:predicted membrane channel-forming protein YqfA (hemolysin III family)